MQNLKKILLYGAAVLGIILIVFAVGTMKVKNQDDGAGLDSQSPVAGNSETRINEEGGVVIEVAPIEFGEGEAVKFDIVFTTHQGDLDFDLLKQAVLFDDQGEAYAPQSWSGGSGGHHLQGALVFPALPSGTSKIKLVLREIYGVAEREFEWKIK